MLLKCSGNQIAYMIYSKVPLPIPLLWKGSPASPPFTRFTNLPSTFTESMGGFINPWPLRSVWIAALAQSFPICKLYWYGLFGGNPTPKIFRFLVPETFGDTTVNIQMSWPCWFATIQPWERSHSPNQTGKPENHRLESAEWEKDMLDLVSSQEGNSLGCPVFPIVFTTRGFHLLLLGNSGNLQGFRVHGETKIGNKC